MASDGSPVRDDATSPPGPTFRDVLRQGRQLFTDDVTTLLTQMRERYGPIVDMRMPGGNSAMLVADPESIRYVLEGNAENYRRADVYRNELSELFGDGLLTSEGERWRRQHRLIRPMFRTDSVRSFADLICEGTDAMLERWDRRAERGEPIRLLEEMERVTLLIIGKAMFSADMEPHAADIRDALRILRRNFQREVGSVVPTLPDWVPTPHNRRANAALETLDGIVLDLVASRRRSNADRDDLLSMLLDARTEEGDRMDDEQIRDELVTFLLAGHETTAAALTWTWYLLSRNPAVHERLHEYVTDASSVRDVVGFSAGTAGDESLLKRCVQEAMRIYPPVPVISRQAIDSDRLGGYDVSGGTEVVLGQFVVHRDPELWSDPLAFDPERFAPGAAERPPYSYFPFGGGKRTCIGRSFALVEAQLVLGRAVARHRLSLRSPLTGDPGVDSAVTMVPAQPLEMTVERWAE